MKKAIFLLVLLIITTVAAVPSPVTYNGKTYYMVTSTDPTEDTGSEVCAKVGKVCNGYSETTDAVCKLYHTNANSVSSLSGDSTGVYCNGAPQNGVCANEQDTCHTCSACSNSVTCTQTIGNLYREMYVECVTGQCSIYIGAQNVNDFMAQIPGLNTQLKNCPQTLPAGSGVLFSSGDTQVDILMTRGGTQTFTLSIQNGVINGIKTGASQCVQKITIKEQVFNTAIQSSSFTQALGYLYGMKRYSVTGCNIISKVKLFFVNLVAPGQAQKANPNPPAPKPAPNCGNLGEDCNNRGCFSGICGAAKEQNPDGQWGYWYYKCLDQKEFDAKCVGKGNTPPAYQCITRPCG